VEGCTLPSFPSFRVDLRLSGVCGGPVCASTTFRTGVSVLVGVGWAIGTIPLFGEPPSFLAVYSGPVGFLAPVMDLLHTF